MQLRAGRRVATHGVDDNAERGLSAGAVEGVEGAPHLSGVDDGPAVQLDATRVSDRATLFGLARIEHPELPAE